MIEDIEKDFEDVVTYRGVIYKDQLVIPTDDAVLKDEVGYGANIFLKHAGPIILGKGKAV